MKIFSVVLPLVAALLALVIYLFTAAPFMLWLDAPRFVAAIVTLGVADPPEPLYVLLAHPFIYLPFGSYIFRIQIFSALTAALTLVLIYRLTVRLIVVIATEPVSNKVARLKMLLAGLFSLLTLAFSYQFWSQAQNVETFILVSLIEVIILHLLMGPISKKSLFINLCLIALVFGLATGTNPVIASVIPAILWMMWNNRKKLTLAGFGIWLLIGIASVVAVHLYIPIRAAAKPFLSYWDATDFSSVWNLSTGSGLNVYVPEINRVNGFTGSPEVFFQSSLNFIKSWLINFTILIPFIVAGTIFLWQKSRYYFYCLSSIVATNFFFSGLYFSGNQESWFLVSNIVWATFAGVGYFWFTNGLLVELLSKVNLQKKYAKYGIYLIVMVVVPLIFWWPTLNRKDWTVTEDYINNLYKPMEGKKAILFGSSDLYDSISFYVYGVKGTQQYYPNIVPITDNLLYILPWYRKHLVDVTDLKIPDDSSLKFDSAKEYSKFANDFFAMNMGKYQVYVSIPASRNNFLYGGQDLGASFKIDEERFKLVPQGMLYQVVPKDEQVEPDLKNFEFVFQNKGFPQKKPSLLENTYSSEMTGIINEYAYSFENLGDYYLKQNKPDQAFKYYQQAYDFNSNNAEVISRLGNYYGSTGNHGKAAEYFEKALKIEPRNIGLLFNVAIAYENTGRIDKAISKLNEVLRSSKKDPQISQLAQTRLDMLMRQSSDSALATSSGQNKQILPQLQVKSINTGWQNFSDPQMNLQFSYPAGFTVKKEDKGVIELTNNLSGKDQLTFDFYAKRLTSNSGFEEIGADLPFAINGPELISQPVGINNFEAIGKTYGTGEHLTFVLLMRKGNTGIAVKVYPGDSNQVDEFNKILQSVNTNGQ